MAGTQSQPEDVPRTQNMENTHEIHPIPRDNPKKTETRDVPARAKKRPVLQQHQKKCPGKRQLQFLHRLPRKSKTC